RDAVPEVDNGDGKNQTRREVTGNTNNRIAKTAQRQNRCAVFVRKNNRGRVPLFRLYYNPLWRTYPMPFKPEDVLAKLLPFLSYAYKIYEAVVLEATFEEFISKGETEIEGCHHSSAVRIRVKRALRRRPPDLHFVAIPLAFNGIEVHHQ